MVVPRDRGGNLLMPDLRVHALYLGADHNSGAEFPIEFRADTSGLAVGGIRFNTPSLVLIGVLISYPLLWLLFYSRTRSHGPLVAMVIAIGFLAIFAALAWRDWQTLTTWRETTCTIVDSRLRPESSAPLAVEPVTRRRRGTENVHQTLLALRYDVNGRETISTGFDTGSRLSVGGIAAAIEEYSRWPIGAAVPCRYDPGDVGDVVVVPGFGGAYLFALFPLMLLVLGVAAIRRPRAWR
jgi:hypothetical protein